jgi:hypothetical protein
MLPPDGIRYDGLLFVPRWLGRVNAFAASVLTARVVASGAYNRETPDGRVRLVFGQGSASGTIVPKADQLAAQARVEGALRARKEARTEEQYAGRNWAAHMDRRAERRAAKEARRIMNERRAACVAAFTKEEIDG